MKSIRRRRWPWVILGLFAFGFVVLALSVDSIVTWQTKRGLAMIEGYSSTFSTAKLRLFKLTYELDDFKMMKLSAGGEKEPFFYAKHLEVSVLGEKLKHRQLVARVKVLEPHVNLIAAKSKAQQQLEVEDPNLAEKLDRLMPLTVDRIEVRKAEVMFIDKTEPDFPRIWLHDLDATVENLATRRNLADNRPTSAALSGSLQKSAMISAFVTADPLQKGLNFAGRAELRHLELTEFYQIISSKSGLHVENGTVDSYAQFTCRNGQISGGVEAVLKNPKVVAGKPGLDNTLKAVLADASLDLLSDRVDGGKRAATVIPLSGKVTKPEAQLWPTVLGVIRNAFVVAISEGFESLPPPKAQKPENPVKQTIDALDPGKAAPKEQPKS